jgi:hypothetical protein
MCGFLYKVLFCCDVKMFNMLMRSIYLVQLLLFLTHGSLSISTSHIITDSKLLVQANFLNVNH